MAQSYLNKSGLSHLWEIIKGYFIKKSGDTMNGTLTVDNAFDANSATIGNLVVTGNASFTNDIQGNLVGTVNGATPIKGGSNAKSAVTIKATTTDIYSMTSAGSVTAGTATTPAAIDTSKFNGGSYSHSGFSGGSYTRGAFNAGSLSMTMDTTDTKKLIITFTPPSHANDSFTPASYGTDSFTAASLSSGFYTAGTKGTPTAVTLPTRSSSPIKAWTGYTTGVANTYAEAQTFTGTPC